MSLNERKNFSYDDYSNSLIISNRQENEIVRENFEIGDIIFSLTGKGKIVSIEIRGISSFLESCNINLEILEKAKNISFGVKPKNNSLFIMMIIESIEKEHYVSKQIPLVVPIISQ